MNKLISAIVLLSFSLTSCSTIRRQTDQPVFVCSNPSGAKITVDGTPMGITPLTLSMKPQHPHRLLLEKEGYQPKLYEIHPKVNPKKVGTNLIFPVGGAAIGTGVGLIMAGGSAAGLNGLIVMSCGILGFAAGAAAGVLGAGIDLVSGTARTLPNKICAELEIE